MTRLTDDMVLHYSDFDASKLAWHQRRTSTRRQYLLAVLGIGGIFASVAIAVAAGVYLAVSVHRKWILLEVLPGLIALFIVRNLPSRNLAGSKRDWRACPTFHGPVSFWGCEDGIEMRTVHMDVLFRYHSITIAAESPDAFSLVCGDTTMVIPKRATNSDQQHAIRTLLKEKVPGFTVIPAGQVHMFNSAA